MSNRRLGYVSTCFETGYIRSSLALAFFLIGILSCGNEDEPETPSASFRREEAGTPAPVPPPVPLVSGGVGSATALVAGGTATIGLDRTSGRGEFSFQRGDVKLDFGKGELPRDFPADIPLPENGRIASVLQGPGIPTQVLIQLPRPYQEARAAYLALLEQNGWTVAKQRELLKGEGVVFGCQRGEHTLAVTLKGTGSGTSLTLQLGGLSSISASADR